MTNPLKMWRADQKLSRSQVGELFGVDGQTIYRWEKGEHLPRQKYWANIEKETGIAPEKLVEHLKIEAAQ